jgi:hypothetical protein
MASSLPLKIGALPAAQGKKVRNIARIDPEDLREVMQVYRDRVVPATVSFAFMLGWKRQ